MLKLISFFILSLSFSSMSSSSSATSRKTYNSCILFSTSTIAVKLLATFIFYFTFKFWTYCFWFIFYLLLLSYCIYSWIGKGGMLLYIDSTEESPTTFIFWAFKTPLSDGKVAPSCLNNGDLFLLVSPLKSQDGLFFGGYIKFSF